MILNLWVQKISINVFLVTKLLNNFLFTKNHQIQLKIEQKQLEQKSPTLSTKSLNSIKFQPKFFRFNQKSLKAPNRKLHRKMAVIE